MRTPRTSLSLAIAATLLASIAVGCAAPAPPEPSGSSSSKESYADGNGVTVGWMPLAQSESYGLVSSTVDKVYPNDAVADDCGGAYSVTASIDVGAVGEDSVEIRSVTFFYNANQYTPKPRGWMDIYSNGTPNVHADTDLQTDENGVVYQTFPIATTFEGVRADGNHGIVIEHFVTPGAPYIPGFGGENVCGTTAKFVLYVE